MAWAWLGPILNDLDRFCSLEVAVGARQQPDFSFGRPQSRQRHVDGWFLRKRDLGDDVGPDQHIALEVHGGHP